MAGLYVHVPFCVRKCLYCDFYSEPMRGPIARRLVDAEHEHRGDYLAALAAELKGLPAGFSPESVFIGGGTPTELSTRDLAAFFDLLRQCVDLSRVTEWTCETNPGTLTPAKCGIMMAAGVNRVSMGVQSFDPKVLEFLGRIHSAAEADAGYELLRSAGFRNINLDLIYGIPGQTTDSLDGTLAHALSLRPEHLACYCLIFEEGTPLTDLRNRGFVREVEDDDEIEQYALVRRRLSEKGYQQYEISNFAQPGRACRHNLLYWSGGEYIGVGPSAHSHWQGERYANAKLLSAYAEKLGNGSSPVVFRETLAPESKARETLVMWLRRTDGVDREEFRKSTGFDYRALAGDAIVWMQREGLLEDTGSVLRLTEQGLFVSDAVFAELV